MNFYSIEALTVCCSIIVLNEQESFFYNHV